MGSLHLFCPWLYIFLFLQKKTLIQWFFCLFFDFIGMFYKWRNNTITHSQWAIHSCSWTTNFTGTLLYCRRGSHSSWGQFHWKSIQCLVWRVLCLQYFLSKNGFEWMTFVQKYFMGLDTGKTPRKVITLAEKLRK